MNNLTWLAVLIEFGGALVISAHVGHAAWLALRTRSPGPASAMAARGLAAGLDFKLAATLLKTVNLVSWNQIAMFAAILALRIFVKKTLLGGRTVVNSRPASPDSSY